MNSTFDKPQSSLSLRKSLSTDDIPLLDKESPPRYVTTRSRMKTSDVADQVNSSLHTELMNFQQTIIGTMNAWFAKQDEKLSVIVKNYDKMKETVKFVSDKYDDLDKKTENIKTRTVILENKVDLINRQTAKIQDLEYKMDSMEQSARQCNVEIFKLPEKRTENLLAIVHKIGDFIGCPVHPQDLVSAHRVPHADKNSKLPKNVIVKFASKLFKENFLTSARKKRGMTTVDLDVPGATQSQIIYVNEHLTLKNKLLYKEARDAAKLNGFRHVWTQNGTVLVRATGTSPIFAVRSKEEVLKKMKPSSN